LKNVYHISPGLLFIVLLPCAGCTKSGDNPADSSHRTWKLFGQTFLVGSTSPAGGVLISCAGVSTTSGPDGSYQLSDIPAGAQIITAVRNDCSGYSDTIFVDADTRYYVFLNLRTTHLTGIVSNVIDGPIVSASVKMSGITSVTDIAGRYELTGLPPGTDTLYVTQPDYVSYKTAISLTTPDQQSNIILTRERVVQGTVTEDAFVDESFPDNNNYTNQFLALSTTGVNLPAKNHRNIFIKFSFPSFLSDYRVSVLSASLDMTLYSSPLQSNYQTYAVASDWTRRTITYNTQPAFGSSLSAGNFGDGHSGKYWSFLDLSGANTLLADWRANKPIYGIVIQGGGQNNVTYFYALESLGPAPRITFTVRY
jgi:hypothetical protein